jgi:hypothetical protein
MPELRVWPKRTIIAGVVAIAAFVLITAAFLFLQYIRDAADAALGK